MSLECYTTRYVKFPQRNGGYCTVGDGNMVTELHLEKDGITLKLDDEEIIELMKCLKGVNPTIYI